MLTPVMAAARAWLSARWPLLAAAAVVALLSWPIDLDAVHRGLDASYATNLHLLAGSSLAYGRDIVFLYGPLGSLAFPTFVSGTSSVLAILVTVVVTGALAYRIMALLARRGTTWAAILAGAAFVLLGLRALAIPQAGASMLPEAAVLLIVLWAVDWVIRPYPTPVPPAGVIGLTAFATAFGMVKAQLAVVGFVLAAVGIGVRAWSTGGRRQLLRDGGLMAATAVVTLVGLWIVSGQPIGALPDYVRGSLEIVGGYSDAMNRTTRTGDITAALLIAAVILVLLVTARGLSHRRRIVATLTVLAVLVLGAKEGFVRSDPLHTPRYFLIAGAVAFVCATVWGSRTAIAVALGCTALVVSILGVTVGDSVNVVDRLEWAAKTARYAVSSSYRADTIAQARADLRDQYHLAPEIVTRVDGRTVEIEPYETGIQFAYPEIVWDPAPVFHRVNAYTSFLDERNADKLSGADRPDFVLRQPGVTVDERYPRFDAPSANRAIACHYREVFADDEWQLLASVPDRCGTPKEQSTTRVRLGESVKVPVARPDEMVIARFDGVGTSLRDTVQSTLLSGREFRFDDRSAGTRSRSYRFLPGTQADDHIMSVPACLTDAVDGKPVTSFALTSGGATDAYDVTFLTVPVRC